MAETSEFKIAILSILISACVSIAVTDYHDYEQASSNKKAAAEQLSIEIKSLNQSLHQSADYYNKNLDLRLTSNGETPVNKNNISDTFIINIENKNYPPIVMVVNNSEISWKQIEIDSVNNGNFSWNLPIFYDTVVNSVKLNAVFIPPPLYNEHGMYYLYLKDISNFNNNVAQDIYSYYYYVTTAEADREYLENSLGIYGVDVSGASTNFTNQQFYTYIDMRVNLIKANAIEQTVLKELENEKNENFAHFVLRLVS